MDKNNIKKQNVYISEEEKTLNWEEIQNAFKKTFGSEVYNSWLQKNLKSRLKESLLKIITWTKII